MFPSGEPGVSGDFWGSQEGCQGPFRPTGRNRGLPLRRRRGQGCLGNPMDIGAWQATVDRVAKSRTQLKQYSVAKLYLILLRLWTVACQGPLSMGFPRQEHWSGLPLPSLVLQSMGSQRDGHDTQILGTEWWMQRGRASQAWQGHCVMLVGP